jgi:hypothetical protein
MTRTFTWNGFSGGLRRKGSASPGYQEAHKSEPVGREADSFKRTRPAVYSHNSLRLPPRLGFIHLAGLLRLARASTAGTRND